MKKEYQKPTTNSVIIKIGSVMISASRTEAASGTSAMSRESSSYWDDDEE